MSGGFASLGAEYEDFLFAIVCNQANGTPLTMASLIARSGADPWQEAARISKLRREAALHAMAGFMPDEVSQSIGPVTVTDLSDRLLALLPKAKSVLSPVAKKGSRYEVLLFGLGLALYATVVMGQLVWANMHTRGEAPGMTSGDSLDKDRAQ